MAKKAAKKIKKAAQAVAEADVAVKAEKKAKKERPARKFQSTAEVAKELGVTPVRLRRILRSEDFMPDKEYTRYDLDPATVERLRQALAAGTSEKKAKKGRKGKKSAAVEEAASEEVQEELAELESEDEDEEDEELELDEDEDEEEEEDEDEDEEE